jgi:twitching motility protein PilT
VRAVESLLDAFPEAERGSACRRVADTLRAVVAQRLVPAKDDGSYALAFEVLLVDDGVRQLIREGELGHLLAAIESGRVYGSCLLDDSLALLVQSGRISLEMARSQARNAQNFAAPRE